MTSTSFKLQTFSQTFPGRGDVHSLRELRRLANELAIDKNHGAAVIVQSIAVALYSRVSSQHHAYVSARRTYTNLVRIQIDTSVLASSLRNERNALVQFSQRMVAATAVGENFNAVEAPTFRSANIQCQKNTQSFSHFNMRAVGRKELLASLGSQASVNS